MTKPLERSRLRLRRFRAKLAPLHDLRGAQDVCLLVRVTALAAAVRVVVRLPLPRQAALLERPARRTRARPASALEAERIVRCVETAQSVGSPLVRRGCLTRGMILYWLLGRSDDDVELCFGLGDVNGQVSGHCWLTREDRPYLERIDPTGCFEAIYRIPVPRVD